MINEKLSEYMKKIKIYNDKISEYIDNKKGVCYTIPTGQLFPKIDYLELSKEKNLGKVGIKISEYDKAVFDKIIEDDDYESVKIKKLVPKSEITGKKEDFMTIIEKEEDGIQLWTVSNGIGIKECFKNKNEAIKLYEGIKNKVKKYYE